MHEKDTAYRFGVPVFQWQCSQVRTAKLVKLRIEDDVLSESRNFDQS